MGDAKNRRRTGLLGGRAVIFVTVGTQLPFDRLIVAVDEWASCNHCVDILAQIGPSHYTPRYIQYLDFLSADEIGKIARKSDLIISHAGMGSILLALSHRKPIIIMPRRCSLRETRNDHQLATAKIFTGKPGVYVAWHEINVKELLDKRQLLSGGEEISDVASPQLLDRIARFINNH